MSNIYGNKVDFDFEKEVYFCLSFYLEVGEGDGPAAGMVVAGQQEGTVALQAADVVAVVGGGSGSVHLAGIEHRLL